MPWDGPGAIGKRGTDRCGREIEVKRDGHETEVTVMKQRSYE